MLTLSCFFVWVRIKFGAVYPLLLHKSDQFVRHGGTVASVSRALIRIASFYCLSIKELVPLHGNMCLVASCSFRVDDITTEIRQARADVRNDTRGSC